VLIIDAMEGVRDQTRRHGYLLHLARRQTGRRSSTRWTGSIFSAADSKAISDEIFRASDGLGVTPKG